MDKKEELLNIHAKIIGETITEKIMQLYKQYIDNVSDNKNKTTSLDTISEQSLHLTKLNDYILEYKPISVLSQLNNTPLKSYNIETQSIKISEITCIFLDFVFTPFIFCKIWNYMMSELFGLPKITYIHALLIKLTIELYFRTSFCSYFIERETLQKNESCMKQIHEKISKIESLVYSHMKSKDNLSKEPKAYNSLFSNEIS